MLAVDEQCHILRLSGARIAVVGEAQLAAALRVRAEVGCLQTVIGVNVLDQDGVISWLESIEGRPGDAPNVEIDNTATARVSFTGGTTGLPKALVHRADRVAINLVAHIIEMELTAGDRVLLTTPLAHAAGLFMEATLLRGGTVHLGNGFDAVQVVDRIRTEGITYVFLVPTMLYRLLDALEFDGGGVDTLRTILYGAAPMNPDRLRQGLALLGEVFIQFYGQAEAPNFITRLGREDHVRSSPGTDLLTSCGRATTMARVRIVDEDGHSVAPREVGEVVVSTPYTMAG
jgi:fatty-acyl-CoA synthase